MRKLIYTALLAAMVLSMGCAVTNYPVIFDTRGAVEDEVVDSYYDKAYIIPSSQVATIWPDGSDELFTLATQDWKGDRRLFTYNNFDSSASVLFLDQTYCDPTRQTNCAITTAWDPDLPDNYPHGSSGGSTGQGGDPNETDDPFDYVYDGSCSGARSLSLLLSMGSRIGECGSGIWQDKQNLAGEFALLEKVDFRGLAAYHLPMDSQIMTVEMNDGTLAPVFGVYNGYLIEDDLNLALPVTPNAKYQLRWLDQWIRNNGSFLDITVTYGSLTANFKLNVTTVEEALNRL